MKYINFKQGAEADELFLDECAIPDVAPHQVRIRVHAFGVNRADTLQRMGNYPPPAGESPILGLEAAGVIDEVGSSVTQWQQGERVFALVPGGGYAEHVVVNADHVMPIPHELTFTDAAGIAEVFLTAYQSLFLVGDVKEGDNILIHAGASGVGLAATQLATHFGANVAVTASAADKLALCKKMGACVQINYKEQDFVEEIKKHFSQEINFILDVVGGEYVNRNLKVLATDGVVVQLAILAGRYADKLDLGLMLKKRATLSASTLRNRSDKYKSELIATFSESCLSAFVNQKLTANIDTVYNVSEVGLAHKRLESNDTKGKLIITW
ncbi:NAD(P)H-quinone oxidoreductase [Alteromonas sp. ASW11-130]|uniref:NAD(P)H-quinone oxidoreductase n=1 Tax=Alteromonas sp. ASW11-130 TaxID=3015775 RepID=UPI002242382C|nr:NAD(P)H-quinone oxidoreductase [Alteromonas sp. ASW11-130]MCW8091984.1 NAD(P)H-quinone oxidoreductase [Alteromonas sp. ASW11-130]